MRFRGLWDSFGYFAHVGFGTIVLLVAFVWFCCISGFRMRVSGYDAGFWNSRVGFFD